MVFLTVMFKYPCSHIVLWGVEMEEIINKPVFKVAKIVQVLLKFKQVDLAMDMNFLIPNIEVFADIETPASRGLWVREVEENGVELWVTPTDIQIFRS